jgi:hypothetical protein
MKNRTVASWQENGMLYTLTATPIDGENVTDIANVTTYDRSTEMISVFEYLGKRTPATGVGAKIYDYAKSVGAKTDASEIDTTSYKGKIMLYERGFLDEYFNKPETPETPQTVEEDDDLPF